MLKSLWVLNQKGGTGKTTLSTTFVDHIKASGAQYRVIDADCQPDAKSTSSLSAIFPTAERMEIGASPDALMAKPTLAVGHWDSLFELARISDLFVDFGANVSSSLMYWLDASDIGPRLSRHDIIIDIVIVTTANPDSVADALELVHRLRELIPAGSRRMFVALNQAAGAFDAYAATQEMNEFIALVEAGELALVSVPRCTSEIWLDVEKARLTAFGATAMSSDELQLLLRTPELETARGRKALAKWHRTVIDSFIDAGLFPNDQTTAAA